MSPVLPGREREPLQAPSLHFFRAMQISLRACLGHTLLSTSARQQDLTTLKALTRPLWTSLLSHSRATSPHEFHKWHCHTQYCEKLKTQRKRATLTALYWRDFAFFPAACLPVWNLSVTPQCQGVTNWIGAASHLLLILTWLVGVTD